MRILCLGDIAGPAALDFVCARLWKIRKDFKIDFVVANGENCALGNGIDKESAEKLFICGCDVITTGNHIWKKKSIRGYLDDCNDIIRPLNYTEFENGSGYTIKDVEGTKLLVINAVGNVYMSDSGISSPFEAIDAVLEKNKGAYDIAILDFHAETTSEKYAIGRYFDGRIDIVFGTHTHVQTADERILPNKTGYITDLGMCGSDISILGIKSDIIISRYMGEEGRKFEFDDRELVIHGAIFETDTNTFGIKNVTRIKIPKGKD